MKVFGKIEELRKALKELKNEGKSIGLVPTMGALHQGHAALVKQAIETNDYVVCSIFVNPIQFNNEGDLKAYPRTTAQDHALLETLGCQLVFQPDAKEMYPKAPNLSIGFGALEKPMEGAFRSGHFNGVGLVVSKLFNIVAPTNAYFGQKDLQQYQIINNLVETLNFDIKLVCVPIVREKNGLAISSRNQRLNPSELDTASNLYKALQLAGEAFNQNKPIGIIKDEVAEFLCKFPAINLEYLEIVDKNTLESLKELHQINEVAICIAAYIGEVRLIDNIILKK